MSKFKNTMIEIDDRIASDVESGIRCEDYKGTAYQEYYDKKWDQMSFEYAQYIEEQSLMAELKERYDTAVAMGVR